MKHKLDNNKYLKGKIIQLEDWKDVNFQTNEMDGVDVYVEFDLKELKVEVTQEEFEEYIVDDCLHYDKDIGLFQGTGDEAWYNNHSEELVLPHEPLSNTVIKHQRFFKIQNDFHLWLLFEKYILESGYYPNIFDIDYYGYVDGTHKFDEEYGENFPEDEKKKLKEIENLLEIFKVNDYLEDHCQQLYDLPDCLTKNLSDLLTNYDEVIEIMKIEEIKYSHVIVECLVEKFMTRDGKIRNMDAMLRKLNAEKIGDKNQYGETEFRMRINLKNNSTRYILEGGKDENRRNKMSFLSVG